MKKLKLKALELGAKEVLTREELKKILGGDDGSGSTGVACTSNANCQTNEKCSDIAINNVHYCVKISIGATCTVDSDCGNNQKCVNKPAPSTEKWCNVAN